MANRAATIATTPQVALSRPSEKPDRISVAGPVCEAWATSVTGRLSVPVKYSVSRPMTSASTTPMPVAAMK